MQVEVADVEEGGVQLTKFIPEEVLSAMVTSTGAKARGSVLKRQSRQQVVLLSVSECLRVCVSVAVLLRVV